MSECGMLSVVMLSFVVPIVLAVYTVNLYENFFSIRVPDFKKTFSGGQMGQYYKNFLHS
jgi:hypothetical protein